MNSLSLFRPSLRPVQVFCACLALSSCATLVATAQADIVSADFEESLDLPAFSTGPRILQNDGASLGNGYELDEANEISNPSNWRDSLQVDLAPTLLTLTPTGNNTYQTITLTISNIVFSTPGEGITGFTLLTNNAVVQDGNPFTTDLSFTSDSLTVSYNADDIPAGHDFMFPDGTSTSTFGVTTGPVPEASSWAMLLGGAGLLGGVQRWRRARQA